MYILYIYRHKLIYTLTYAHIYSSYHIIYIYIFMHYIQYIPELLLEFNSFIFLLDLAATLVATFCLEQTRLSNRPSSSSSSSSTSSSSSSSSSMYKSGASSSQPNPNTNPNPNTSTHTRIMNMLCVQWTRLQLGLHEITQDLFPPITSVYPLVESSAKVDG